jgi:hypothetical protein
MISESYAVTPYGFRQGNRRVIVNAAAQWTSDGQTRLIQAVENLDEFSWIGRTFARPTNPADAEYWDSIFWMLVESGGMEQRTIER